MIGRYGSVRIEFDYWMKRRDKPEEHFGRLDEFSRRDRC